jgi:hypothetical protein
MSLPLDPRTFDIYDILVRYIILYMSYHTISNSTNNKMHANKDFFGLKKNKIKILKKVSQVSQVSQLASSKNYS